MVCKSATCTINFQDFELKARSLALNSGIKGRMSRPEIKKRIPAKLRGVVYFKPIFMAAKGVAQSKQAIMAKKLVERRRLFIYLELYLSIKNPFVMKGFIYLWF